MSSLYVWYSRTTSVTGRNLKNKIGCDGGVRPPKSRHKKIICWGARLPRDGAADSVLQRGDMEFIGNDVRDIDVYANKLKALRKMDESGVRIPTVYPVNNYTGLTVHNGLCSVDASPVIGRRLHHHGGSGCYVCNSPRDIAQAVREGCCYFLGLIDAERELRIHVFDDKIIRRSIKVESQTEETTNHIIKSRKNGWRLRHFRKERYSFNGYSDAIAQSMLAVRSLGYKHGVVDVVIDNNGLAYVLEVNSGAGLDDEGLEIYSNIFRGIAGDFV